MVIVRRDAGASPDSRYAHAGSRHGPFPAGTPLVAILRCEELASPDEFAVTESSRHNRTFLLNVERRRYKGSLAANVVTVAFVELDLGPLDAGDYELVAQVTTLEFDEYERPERARNPSRREHRLAFQVR